jgi:YfiH family protein
MGDAVLTNRKGLAIGVQVADCVPILLYDRKKQVAGAVHAGWRGTAEGIVGKTIAVLCERFASSPEDVVLAIGPGIRGSCYEVGVEVLDAVTRTTGRGDYIFSNGDKQCLDLPAANRLQAISAGVPADNIWISDECTHCLPDKYHSYRYSMGAAGRQYAYVSIM